MLSIISNGLGGLLNRKRAFDYIKHLTYNLTYKETENIPEHDKIWL